MATDVDICNLALDNLGVTNKIASLVQQTKESLACARWYPTIRDRVLSHYPWPFATRFATLVEDEAEENPAWDHVYTLPTDFLVGRRIVVDGNPNAPPFDVVLSADGSKRVLVSDAEAVVLEYTARPGEALFPSAFVEALAWKLSSALIVPLAIDAKNVVNAVQMYQMTASEAFAIDANGRQFKPLPESETIQVRE